MNAAKLEVERVHRTHIAEFYEVTDDSFDLPDIREKLLDWERICDTVRPNQAIKYLTPLELVNRWKQNQNKYTRRLCVSDHMNEHKMLTPYSG